MLKTENPIIFTGFEDESYFLRALYFGIFCFCVCNFFLFSLKKWGSRQCNIYMVYNHRPTPIHQQPTYQHNFLLLQLTIGNCQMNYKMLYQQCQLIFAQRINFFWNQWSTYAKYSSVKCFSFFLNIIFEIFFNTILM
jgi:hypothetical protein